MKYALVTAIAAFGFAAPAVAQTVDGNPQVMTRNVPAETVFGPADSGRHFNDTVAVSFGEKFVVEMRQFGNDTPARSEFISAYVFDGAGDTGNNDFVGR